MVNFDASYCLNVKEMGEIRLKKTIKELREEKGISQTRMAFDLKIAGPLISRIENGDIEPGINRAMKIANYLGCKVEDIVWKKLK